MTGQIYPSYSFLDTQATVSAPGFTFDLASSGPAEEGIRISMIGEKDVMTIGAAGDGMHTQVASNAARVEVTLLKTAPGNALLNSLYNTQSSPGGANWGGISLTINNPNVGDSVTLNGGAFAKQADIAYSGQASLMVWSFNFIIRGDILGNGFNQLAVFVPAT